MILADAVLVCLWVGLTCYALLAGADFGAGAWDLVAGSATRGARQRDLIEHAIGPVWEANHVWLVFVLVVLWTGFPPAFAAIASTLYIPLTGVALGVIARGAAFAFRKNVEALAHRRLFGAAFASSSVLTPFFLGTVAGGIASGRVPPGLARGDVVGSWVNPTSLLAGVLAVGICAYLAAVYLCADAVRAAQHDLAEAFRRRALGTGLIVGVVALAGIAVLHADAPLLFAGLTGRALPVVAASAVAGLASLWLLTTRRFRLVRITAALAVTAVLWAWAVAQFPLLLVPSLSIDNAAAGQPTLRAILISLIAGAVVLVPSLAWLFWLFQQHPQQATNPHSQGGQRAS
ncbi:MAG: cytochrome D ubiquinol oxidase subunit II [Catenulispora sp. 13_1_20CM_3_70_7]|jgi:cytochrome bd ubiquinol oxidase subunit II|nr:MAG: cytochrome D ubiquinol oxidase subunit II [Catenulispora sp. 13_1_20CM_3_70_7]